MGVISNLAIYGICVEMEGYSTAVEEIVVPNMHTRKQMFFERVSSCHSVEPQTRWDQAFVYNREVASLRRLKLC